MYVIIMKVFVNLYRTRDTIQNEKEKSIDIDKLFMSALIAYAFDRE
jgi:hypothetical protein